MKGTEFLAANAGKSLTQWEANAVLLAQQDSFVPWPMVPVTATSRDGKHSGTFFIASDYFAIGQVDDFVRLPLTPLSAQKIANSKGMLLPTSKMVEDIWRASSKLKPQPMVPNRGANLTQYAEHSRAIDEQLLSSGVSPLNTSVPIAGTKKDVILSNIWKPGKVIIYGWHKPSGSAIQGKSNIHGDFYVDYSHGLRLVAPNMEVDGKPMSTEEVLKSPTYASLLSDEGPLTRVRYPAGGGLVGQAGLQAAGGYSKLGVSVLISLTRRAA